MLYNANVNNKFFIVAYLFLEALSKLSLAFLSCAHLLFFGKALVRNKWRERESKK